MPSGQYERKPKPIAERFWRHVDKRSGHGPWGDCWLWLGAKRERGHGTIHAGYKKAISVHRLSYELAFGPIPAGMQVRHRCDLGSCVNPEHLEVGTHKQNMQDRDERGRTPRGENCNHARLTENQVLQIRLLYSCGYRQSELARNYKICQANLHEIVNRKTWKHI